MTNQTPEAKSNPFFQVGDKVPDVTLRDENGQEVALASFWEDRPALLVFLRHFGWPFCRAYLSQLRQNYVELQKQGLQVVAVGMGNPSEAVSLKRRRGIPFPLLSDTGQRSYRAFGLGYMNMVQEIQANATGALIRETLHGNFAGMPVGDINQLGGTFLVDQEGIARYIHRARSTNDYPTGSQLLKIFA